MYEKPMERKCGRQQTNKKKNSSKNTIKIY
jgi:hypothetical protein